MKNAIIQKLVVWSVVILTAGASATRRYVDPKGPSSPNSPGDYLTIQAAVDASKDGDEVILTDGIYMGRGNRDIDVDNAITLRSQNDPVKCIIDCNEDSKGYHYGFRIHGEGVTIEGISIINARSENGAALIFENHDGKSTIINCILSGNSAARQGGAVYLERDSDAEFYNCTFRDNLAPKGGAIYCQGSLSLINSNITKNSAVSDNRDDNKGGGIFVEYNGYQQNITIQNCLFSENSASDETIYKAPPGYGGAVYCEIYSNYDSFPISIENCTFNNNRVMGDNCAGAAFYIEGHGSCDSRKLFNLIFTNCSFLQNKAGDSGTKYTHSRGGAIFCEQSRILLYKCIFRKNEATEAAAMYFGRLKAVIVNCVISGHTQRGSMKGSCISFENQQEQSIILRSTITGNILYAIRSNSRENPIIIRNSIIYGNNYPYGDYISQIEGFSHISYNCVQNIDKFDPLYVGEGNIDVDPCFVDAGHWDTNDTEDWRDDVWVEGDYRLKDSSLCRDAGCYPQYFLDNTDLDDKPRIVGAAIDMGAYETRLPAIEVKLFCVPRSLNIHSPYNTIIALLTMPDDIKPDDVDPNEPLFFEPCRVKSKRQMVYQRNWHGKSRTCVMAVFDLSDRMDKFSDGPNKVTVKSRLKTGRRYYGTDTIRLVSWSWFRQ